MLPNLSHNLVLVNFIKKMLSIPLVDGYDNGISENELIIDIVKDNIRKKELENRIIIACYFRRRMSKDARSRMLWFLTGQPRYKCLGQFHYCNYCGQLCSPIGKAQFRFRVCIDCIKILQNMSFGLRIYVTGKGALEVYRTLVANYAILEARVRKFLVRRSCKALSFVTRWYQYPRKEIDDESIQQEYVDRALVNRFFHRKVKDINILKMIIEYATSLKNRTFKTALYCHSCGELRSHLTGLWSCYGKNNFSRILGNICYYCKRIRNRSQERNIIDVSLNCYNNSNILKYIYYEHYNKKMNDYLLHNYKTHCSAYNQVDVNIMNKIKATMTEFKLSNEWLKKVNDARSYCQPIPKNRSKNFRKRFPEYNKQLFRYIVKGRIQRVRKIDICEGTFSYDPFKLLTFLNHGDRWMALHMLQYDDITNEFPNTSDEL